MAEQGEKQEPAEAGPDGTVGERAGTAEQAGQAEPAAGAGRAPQAGEASQAPKLVFKDPLNQQTGDDTDAGWGESSGGRGLDWYLNQRPPHHGG